MFSWFKKLFGFGWFERKDEGKNLVSVRDLSWDEFDDVFHEIETGRKS